MKFEFEIDTKKKKLEIELEGSETTVDSAKIKEKIKNGTKAFNSGIKKAAVGVTEMAIDGMYAVQEFGDNIIAKAEEFVYAATCEEELNPEGDNSEEDDDEVKFFEKIFGIGFEESEEDLDEDLNFYPADISFEDFDLSNAKEIVDDDFVASNNEDIADADSYGDEGPETEENACNVVSSEKLTYEEYLIQKFSLYKFDGKETPYNALCYLCDRINLRFTEEVRDVFFDALHLEKVNYKGLYKKTASSLTSYNSFTAFKESMKKIYNDWVEQYPDIKYNYPTHGMVSLLKLFVKIFKN